MAPSLVLLTGASGHMGFRALVNALTAGYHVRAAVRSQQKADQILASASIRALNPGHGLTFVFVADILATGAYDTAVKDVDYILHIASPLADPSDDDEKNIVQPAVKGTVNILEAAAQSPSVKKVVITSSVIAVVPWPEFIANESERIYTADDVVEDSQAAGPYGHFFEAYAASKVKALNATRRFVKERKPQFAVVNVMPGFFIGKSELVTSTEDYATGHGTNKYAFGPVLGQKSPAANPGSVIHVDDVAKVHVLALQEHIKDGQNFGLQSGGVNGNLWDDSLKFVKKHYPNEVKSGVLPANGTQPTKRLRYDASATEKVLGFKFRSYEEQIISVTDHYLELLEKEKGSKA